MSGSQPRRGLVLRRGALGDTLLLTPVLRALARARPELELDFAGVADHGRVLQHFGLVTRAHSSEDFALWSPTQAAARLAPYAWIASDDPAALVAAPRARVEVFTVRPKRRVPLALAIAEQLDVPCTAADAYLLAAPGNPSGPLVFAPGSGAPAKNWPRAHWLAVAAVVPAEVPIAVVVGPVEVERDDPRRWPWPRAVDTWAGMSIVALAERLAGARAYVGNDSGVTHLAALLGVRTLALFGGGEPAVYAPLGRAVTVWVGADQDLAAIAPADVAAWCTSSGQP